MVETMQTEAVLSARADPGMRSSLGNIITIAKREVSGYFASPVAYVFIVIFLVLVPAVGMRMWSEERRHGTIE